MKRAVMTALVVTLLSGTSVLAQERGQGGGSIGRMARQIAGDSQGARTPAPQRETQSQTATTQSSGDRGSGGNAGSRGRDNGGQGRSDRTPAAPQPQAQAPQSSVQQQQSQRPQTQWQGQRRPQGQGQAPGQGQGQSPTARPGGRQGQRGDDGRRPDRPSTAQAERGRGGGGVGEFARDVVREGRNDRNDNRPGWNGSDRDWQGRRPVIRPEDRRDRDRNRPRYDQRRYPHYVTPYQRYRWIGPSYRLPPSFYSFRWQWGQTLPWDWYTPNYYLNDYYAYGLPMPPIGCEWVRVGDDAILVDVFTGRIYQVVYNLFW